MNVKGSFIRKLTEETSYRLDKTLGLIFRTVKKREKALLILTEMRNRKQTNPYRAEEYHDFCKKHEMKEEHYQSILSVLKDKGLIVKVGKLQTGYFKLSNQFIFSLLGEFFNFIHGRGD